MGTGVPLQHDRPPAASSSQLAPGPCCKRGQLSRRFNGVCRPEGTLLVASGIPSDIPYACVLRWQRPLHSYLLPILTAHTTALTNRSECRFMHKQPVTSHQSGYHNTSASLELLIIEALIDSSCNATVGSSPTGLAARAWRVTMSAALTRVKATLENTARASAADGTCA